MLTEKEIKDATKKIDKGEEVCFFRISDLSREPREKSVDTFIADHYTYDMNGGIVFRELGIFPGTYDTKALFYTEDGAMYAYVFSEMERTRSEVLKKMSECIKSMNDQTLVSKDKKATTDTVKDSDSPISAGSLTKEDAKKQQQGTVFVLVGISVLACAASVACAVSSFI